MDSLRRRVVCYYQLCVSFSIAFDRTLRARQSSNINKFFSFQRSLSSESIYHYATVRRLQQNPLT